MKLLCIYDPAIIFPQRLGLTNARDAFDEHNQAQEFFGFKVPMTEAMQLVLAGAQDGTPATAGGIFQVLLNQLNSSERERRFLFVTLDQAHDTLQPASGVLAPHSSDGDIAYLFADLYQLLTWCNNHHPDKARYASGRGDADKTVQTPGEAKDVSIPIVRSRLDWCEEYRSRRKHPANLLPNAFLSTEGEQSLFAFHPPDVFLEDQEELLRQELPQGMLDARKWQRVSGNNRGFKDHWGNYWMWNVRRGHWDVQITESVKNALDAADYHLNVEVLAERTGRIHEGVQPKPEKLRNMLNKRHE